LAGLVMSLLFALVLTAVHVGNHFVPSWEPVMGKPAPTTLRVPYGPRVVRDQSSGFSDIRFEHTRIVVPRGSVLRPYNQDDWAAYSFEQRHRTTHTQRILAVFAIFFTLALGITAYLRRFGHQRLRLLRVQAGLLVVLGLFAIVGKALLLFTSLSELWIPIAAVPLWVAHSFDRRTAFVVAVTIAFVIASFVDLDLVVLTVLLARGMAAALLYVDRKRSRQMIVAGALAGLSAAALFLAIMVTYQGNYDWQYDLGHALGSQLVACFGGGLLGGIAGWVGRAPVARTLGNVPRERLLDLSDLEQPLLMRLAHEAPGTFEHSRAMANLAEQAASAISADALLTRVGAYYHDLGKTTQPKYFVENLSPDERSPHDDLDPEVSADAIMAHVVLGTKILRTGGVPEPVVEFAYTHHGTAMVEYFWNKCLQAGNPKDLDSSAFRYPGMRPQTRESAIVMLVDSIEAASRTIDPPERDAFESMIQRIVFTKLKDGQLDDSGLEMHDLRVIVNRMADALVNMHHHRIKYQWQAKRAQEFGVPSNAVDGRDRPPLPSDAGTRLEPEAHEQSHSATPAPPPVVERESAPVIEVSGGSVVPPAEAAPLGPDTRRSGAPQEPRGDADSPVERAESGAHPALPGGRRTGEAS
jgi:putative nucleotidyltransferase with HDIG domain